MRVLHATSEAFPYVKVGGLSDVLGALPGALRKEGVDARLLLPGFPGVLEQAPGLEFMRPFGWGLPGTSDARLLRSPGVNGVPLYVLDAPSLFARSADPYADFGDSHLTAAALSRAAFDVAVHGDGQGFTADVLHCHDWQTGLAPAYLKLAAARVPSIVTVHNIAYQGVFGPELLHSMWLPRELYHPGGVEFFGRVNLLKTALMYATRITTVSPTYAREIQTPEYGYRLDGVLRTRSRDVRGILNGIDDTVWSPSASPHVTSPYDIDHLERRAANKSALQQDLGLDLDPGAPVFGVVSRLNTMKGLDLLAHNISHLMELGAQLVVLGRGDRDIEGAFEGACRWRPGRIARSGAQDERLAHRIFAGSDFIVVPSRSEPCGLVQMYAMRYGALPIARYTGGLADTVRDETTGEGATGFTFADATGFGLGQTMGRAAWIYREEPARFRQVQETGMRTDFGWGKSAKEYVALYEEIGRGKGHR